MKSTSTNTSNHNQVRIGIAGIGSMGTNHAKWILNGDVPGAELAAVCDSDTSRFDSFPEIPAFTDFEQMLESGLVDAVLIATPHYAHTPLSIQAFEAGIHTLVDKPLGVHKGDCERSIEAHRKNGDPVFGLMFNQRTRPIYRKLKEMIAGGELGAIRRVNWIITDWFRTAAYYDSGGWRATWKGEGGGVLLNQCPHQLDLMQWLFGMPKKVRAFGVLGKYHNIEVEDDITAYLEYEDGATGVFIASTGEAPGTNRLEIAAEMGRVVVENDRIEWVRNTQAMSDFSETTSERFAKPENETVTIDTEEQTVPEHAEVIRGFVAEIMGTGNLVAEGAEGIRSVELGNAMLFSILKDKTVHLPLDSDAYKKLLGELIAGSHDRETASDSVAASDMDSSF